MRVITAAVVLVLTAPLAFAGGPALAADPAEGESFTGSGSDIVDVVAMPDAVRTVVDAFVAEHLVEHRFQKRKLNRADPEALARRGPMQRERG